MRTIIIGLAALAIAAPAAAGKNDRREDYNRYYDNDGYYSGPTWEENGRTRCRRRDGTVGLVVGAAAGALIGRAIDGGRNRTTGTIVGGAVGAVVGREVARNRCN